MNDVEKVTADNAEIREALAKVLQHYPDKGISDYAKGVLDAESRADDGSSVPLAGERGSPEGGCSDSAEKSSG